MDFERFVLSSGKIKNMSNKMKTKEKKQTLFTLDDIRDAIYSGKPVVVGDYRLTVSYDYDSECPNEWGDWKLYSFSTRHVNYIGRDEYDAKNMKKLQRAGLAYPLDCYEHSGIVYSFSGEGTRCKFDTSLHAGILVFTGEKQDREKTLEARKNSAKLFLGLFNKWANGEVYHYTLEKLETCTKCYHTKGEVVDACSGFYSEDDIVSEVNSNIHQ